MNNTFSILFLFCFALPEVWGITVKREKEQGQNKITEQSNGTLQTMNGEGIHKILHAPNIKTLKEIIEQQEKNDFLKQLCEKQKQFSGIPWSCYELHPFEKTYDPSCLKLKLKDLKIDFIKQAVSLKTLSPACRKHLNLKLKILQYRKSKREEIY